jgi:hypothetical protein
MPVVSWRGVPVPWRCLQNTPSLCVCPRGERESKLGRRLPRRHDSLGRLRRPGRAWFPSPGASVGFEDSAQRRGDEGEFRWTGRASPRSGAEGWKRRCRALAGDPSLHVLLQHGHSPSRRRV